MQSRSQLSFLPWFYSWKANFFFLNLWGSVLNLLAKSRVVRKQSNALSEESARSFSARLKRFCQALIPTNRDCALSLLMKSIAFFIAKGLVKKYRGVGRRK